MKIIFGSNIVSYINLSLITFIHKYKEYQILKTYQITVTGKVQGVGFRYHTQAEALRLGLLGTVQNLDDGSVFIIVCGEENSLEKFKNWCAKGPITARVDALEIIETEIRTFDGFVILRKI